MTKPVRLILLALCIILISSALFTVLNNSDFSSGKEKMNTAVAEVQYIKKEYGIPVDSFEVVKGKVQRNAFLSDVLEEFDVSWEVINRMTTAARGIFDMAKFRAGNHFQVFRSKQDRKVKYFVYENSPTEYIMFHLSDTVLISKGTKAIQNKHMEMYGEINSSLWNTMKDKGINPLVALQLSEIYAWNIDFFGLQKGDAFKVIYDESFVDSTSVGIKKVSGAWFKHNGQEYFAIPFSQDGREGYYDQDGKSLRRAFLKAPLRFSRISSRFSNNRFHPVLKIFRPHHGIDYAAPVGTPVEAIGDGTILSIGYNFGGGRTIKIRHNSMYSSGYMHLRGFAPGLHAGSRVKQGEIIGYVGMSGLATGPHLDFRVWANNTPIDPLKIESPSVEPVRQDQLALFNIQKQNLELALAKIKPVAAN